MPRKSEQLVEREHCCRRRDAGPGTNALDEAMVGVEAEPAGCRAAPADGVDARVGEQVGGGEDAGIVELAERGLRQRDLGDRSARSARWRRGTAATMALVERLERGIGDGVSTPRRMGTGTSDGA